MNALIVALMVGAFVVAVLAVAWWIRRYQRDIDAYEQRGYRDPPVFMDPRDGP
jgi:hypothetical protein